MEGLSEFRHAVDSSRYVAPSPGGPAAAGAAPATSPSPRSPCSSPSAGRRSARPLRRRPPRHRPGTSAGPGSARRCRPTPPAPPPSAAEAPRSGPATPAYNATTRAGQLGDVPTRHRQLHRHHGRDHPVGGVQVGLRRGHAAGPGRQGVLLDADQPRRLGDDTGDCAPGHPIGADGRPGECPESVGLMQVRTPYFRDSVDGSLRSSAYNLDVALNAWRNCFDGKDTWLNDVERGRQYGAGDAWGCIGKWFSGRWYTGPAQTYINDVQDYLDQRIWETPQLHRLPLIGTGSARMTRVADNTTCAPLDGEIAALLAELPIDIGAVLGALSDETLPRYAIGDGPDADARAQRPRRTDRPRGAGLGWRRRAGAPAGRRDRRPPVRVLDARRRARARGRRRRRRPLRPVVPDVRVRRRVGASTAWRPRRRTPGRSTTATPAWRGCTRGADAGGGPDPDRHRRASAGGGLAAGLGPAGPRSGRGAAGVPAADLPDDRRPPDHGVEPVGRSDLAAQRQHVRVDRLPRRSQGRRRRAGVRRRRPGPPIWPACRRR